jgi:outer membrane protein TolC
MQINKLLFILLLTAVSLSAADIPAYILRLSDQEGLAVSSSKKLSAAEHDAAAANFRAKVQNAQTLPRLTLEGSYSYVTTVPELALPLPGGLKERLGDNPNYSVGPIVRWTLFDKGSLSDSYLSALSAARSKEFEAEGVRRQILLSVRSAYFQLALAGEQIVLYADALKLSQNQYKDISVQVRAGNKSRKDELSAHQDVLTRREQLSQAQADMAAALRDLSALTGVAYSSTTFIPVDTRLIDNFPAEAIQPTISVATDPLDTLLTKFDGFRGSHVWENHPDLQSLSELAESARLAAKSTRENLWPRLQVSAKSSIDYPNGPVIESFNQNTFGAALTFPLFEAGSTKNRSNDSLEQEQAARLREGQQKTDFTRDWDKTLDQLVNLDQQRRLSEEASIEAGELARITFQSYKSGGATYLEVQNANYGELGSKIQVARIKAQTLMNLAVLASLAQESVASKGVHK